MFYTPQNNFQQIIVKSFQVKSFSVRSFVIKDLRSETKRARLEFGC